jgi:UTP:GlnB (protein PII) uridylyltransferase
LVELEHALVNLDSEDTSIVVLGSLGRLEFTSGSDIDWNLLVDGIADPNHHALFLDAQQEIKAVAQRM